MKINLKNKSLRDTIKDVNILNCEFNKSYVSGFSILMIEKANSITSFTYYDDELGRDEDFKMILNLKLSNDKVK